LSNKNKFFNRLRQSKEKPCRNINVIGCYVCVYISRIQIPTVKVMGTMFHALSPVRTSLNGFYNM
jgi:hypothetical protein